MKHTQHEQILKELRLAGESGINSFVYRTHWIQLPVRIRELKAMGYQIESKTNKDRSVNYILRKEKQTEKKDVTYIIIGNTAYEVKEGQQKLL